MHWHGVMFEFFCSIFKMSNLPVKPAMKHKFWLCSWIYVVSVPTFLLPDVDKSRIDILMWLPKHSLKPFIRNLRRGTFTHVFKFSSRFYSKYLFDICLGTLIRQKVKTHFIFVTQYIHIRAHWHLSLYTQWHFLATPLFLYNIIIVHDFTGFPPAPMERCNMLMYLIIKVVLASVSQIMEIFYMIYINLKSHLLHLMFIASTQNDIKWNCIRGWNMVTPNDIPSVVFGW